MPLVFLSNKDILMPLCVQRYGIGDILSLKALPKQEKKKLKLYS